MKEPELFSKYEHQLTLKSYNQNALRTELGIDHTGVRHPANGGAPKFRRQVRELVS